MSNNSIDETLAIFRNELNDPSLIEEDFVSLVFKMRSLQKQYFKSRSMDILRQSKAAELAVDKAIQEFTSTSKQTSLF
jgi:hypothetical protein